MSQATPESPEPAADALISRLRVALSEKYLIEREVGRGGMAYVYLARDLKHRRMVALKVMGPELSDSLAAERFLREIQTAAQLTHPHIITVLDSGDANGLLYYTMPYVMGESLRHKLDREKQLPLAEAIRIAREVATGLEIAHRHGVIHRDIKPENILLVEGRHACVSDFGLARAVATATSAELTSAGFVVGSPKYMSPEQASADSRVDGRGDVYSLGCVLYEMLAGEPPFAGLNVQLILNQHLSHPPPPIRNRRADVPLSLEKLLLYSLEKDPDSRLPTAAEFAAALSALSEGRDFPEEKRPSASDGLLMFASRMRRTLVRKRLLLGIAVSIALLGVLFRAAGPSLTAKSNTPGSDIIAVMPFSTSGSGMNELGEGMADLLSANLDQVGPIRTTDSRAAVRSWRRLSSGGVVDGEQAAQIARGLGASSVLTGSAVAAGRHVKLTAALQSLNGEVIARAAVTGPFDSIFGLVDALTVTLLRDVWQSRGPVPSVNVSAITTGSLPALRAYLRGMSHYRGASWDSAGVHFREALGRDSLFALAHYQLGLVVGWSGSHGSAEALRYAEAAARFSDRLPERERRLVHAYLLHERGAPDAVDSLRLYTRRYPDDAIGWYHLGDALIHSAAILPWSNEDLTAPFDAAVKRDPSLTAGALHALELEIWEGDAARFNRLYATISPHLPDAQRKSMTRLAAAAFGNDVAARTAVIETIPGMRSTRSGAALYAVHAAFIRASTDRPHDPRLLSEIADSIIAFNAENPPNASRQMPLIALLIGAGRIHEALQVASVSSPRSPSYVAAITNLAAAGLLTAEQRRSALARMKDDASTSNDTAYARYGRVVLMLADGNPKGARQLLAAPLSAAQIRDSPAIPGLMSAARGWADVLEGDTAAGVERLRNGLAEAGYGAAVTFRFSQPLRFVLALALLQNGQTHGEGVRHLQNIRRLHPLLAMPATAALRSTITSRGGP